MKSTFKEKLLLTGKIILMALLITTVSIVVLALVQEASIPPQYP